MDTMMTTVMVAVMVMMAIELLDMIGCYFLLKKSTRLQNFLKHKIKSFLDVRDGQDGIDGIDGKDGMDGEDGKDGMDGHSVKPSTILAMIASSQKAFDLDEMKKSLSKECTESGDAVLDEIEVLRRQIKKLQDGMAVLEEELD